MPELATGPARGVDPPRALWRTRIEQAADLKAEAVGFASGLEPQAWREAERELDQRS
jgi:hypothetical protein